MFLNKRVVLSKCFLILFVIVFPLFVRVNAEDKNNTLVNGLKNILPKSSLSEDTNKESMAFNPVIHDQLETIFKENNERRDTKTYTITNTSDESLREQENSEKNNSQNSTNQEKLTRDKNARTNAYGTSIQDVELDNLIDPSMEEEILKLSKIDIGNGSETLKNVKSEKNASIQGIDNENVPLRLSNKGNQRLLNNETLEDPGKGIGEPLVDTGRAEIDEKADRLNIENESEPLRQLKADKIGFDLEKDKRYRNKTGRQDNQPNRQSKLSKNELGSLKSDESCPPNYGILDCETKFTLNSSEQTITSWQLSCYYFINDQARISISLTNASEKSYELELRTPKSDFKTERKEDNLAPICIPNDDSYSICIYFEDSFLSQPKLVSLHPYLVLWDHYLEKTLPLGTLDIRSDEELKKKHFHHDFKHHTHDSKNHEHDDWKQNQHSDHHHFGKLEIASKYDHHKPLVQFWNPSESGGEIFGHYHHNHNDDAQTYKQTDAQYSSSHQSNVYHHGNAPLFTHSNYGNAPLFTRDNLGNGYDANLHSNVVQNHPESYNRDNAFDKNYRGNGPSYSSGNHSNNMNYYSGNQGNHQYINKSPQYSPSYRKVNAYNSRHHGNVEQSSSGNYDNDRKKKESDNGWEPIISP